MIELPTEGDCPLHAECHGAGFECARCRLDLVRGELASLKAENERLREAVSEVLRECSQENCDGEPYDTFNRIAAVALGYEKEE